MSAPESSPIPDRLYYGPNGHTSRYPSKVVVTAEYIRADLCPKQELAGDMFVSTEPDGSRWVQHADVLKMEAEIEALKSQLDDTRRMLLWLRNHYDLDNPKLNKQMKAEALERVDKLIPSDDSAPDYRDIPHKGITV